VRDRHVWGCPVYVIDHRLQGAQKIPKWDERVQVGAYMGRSPNHAGHVALVLNISTGRVSPQYHIVFDDNFETVEALRKGVVPSRWEYIAKIRYESSTDEDVNLAKLWQTGETLNQEYSDIIEKANTKSLVNRNETNLEKKSVTPLPNLNEVPPPNPDATEIGEVLTPEGL